MGKNKKKGASKKTWIVDCRTDSAFDFALKVLDEAKKEKKYPLELRCNFIKIAYENSKEAIARCQTNPEEFKLTTAIKLFNRNLRKIFKAAIDINPQIKDFCAYEDLDLVKNPYLEKDVPNPYNIMDIEYNLLEELLKIKPNAEEFQYPSLEEFKKLFYHEYKYPSIIEVITKGYPGCNIDAPIYETWSVEAIARNEKVAMNSILLPTNEIKVYIPYEAYNVFMYTKAIDFSRIYGVDESLIDPLENYYPLVERNTLCCRDDVIGEKLERICSKALAPELISTRDFHLEPVMKLLHLAANNHEDIDSIYITLYRIGKNSKIIDSIIDATNNKINCKVFFEIGARGEIENDIKHIYKIFKEANLKYLDIKFKYTDVKVHGKMLLIKTKIKVVNKYFKIGLFSTGNFNEDTAPIYKDYQYVTFKDDETELIERNFDILWNSSQPILSSISSIITKEIYTEIEKGKNGRIWIQTNHLDNKYIVSLLKTAISKGVDVKLIVRTTKGFHSKDLKNCKTVVGKYLEHSRVFIFGKHPDLRMYISSSDILFRNLYNRFEAYIRIPDSDISTKSKLTMDFEDLWAGKQ